MSSRKKPSCPNCQSKKHVVPVVYGLPTKEEMEGEGTTDTKLTGGSRRILLGGCIVTEDSPKWHCLSCTLSW